MLRLLSESDCTSPGPSAPNGGLSMASGATVQIQSRKYNCYKYFKLPSYHGNLQERCLVEPPRRVKPIRTSGIVSRIRETLVFGTTDFTLRIQSGTCFGVQMEPSKMHLKQVVGSYIGHFGKICFKIIKTSKFSVLKYRKLPPPCLKWKSASRERQPIPKDRDHRRDYRQWSRTELSISENHNNFARKRLQNVQNNLK